MLRETKYVSIPMMSSSFSAGVGTPFNDGFEKIDVPIDAIRNVKTPFGIRIDGDSMSPTLVDDDIVVLDYTKKANNGDIVAVQLNDELLIKEFREGHQGIYIHSHNQKYVDRYINSDDSFLILGVVKRLLRDL